MENREIKFLKEKVREQLKRGMYSCFLEPNELKHIIPFLNKTNTYYQMFKVPKASEKIILYSDLKPEITCYKIVSKENFRHQDILGSLFSHQIDRHVFGDIVCIENIYYIIVLSSINDYIKNFFNTIGKYKVNLKEIPYQNVMDYTPQFKEHIIIVPSLRIDVVLAKLLKTSRKTIIDYMNDNKILLNYEFEKNKSKELKENDIVSVRKYGKYRLGQMQNKTKKGNYIIIVKQYY